MKILNSEELGEWIFEHANRLGHRCVGESGMVLSKDGVRHLLNIAWIDTQTGEKIKILYDG